MNSRERFLVALQKGIPDRVPLEDLVSMEIDALNPIERKANMDIKKVKRDWEDQVCLIGNLDLVNSCPMEVVRT